MGVTALVACVIAATCPVGPVAVERMVDIGQAGFDFVLEIAGTAVQKKIDESEQVSVSRKLPDGCDVTIVVESALAEASRVCASNIRLVGDITVKTKRDSSEMSTKAALMMEAGLAMRTRSDAALELQISSIPETLVVTADPPGGHDVEEIVREMSPDLAAKMSGALVLDGLGTVAGARPSGSIAPAASAYLLGFTWVLRVAGPGRPDCGPMPMVFRQGQVFTLALTSGLVRDLIASQYAAGDLPARLSETGLADENGPIRVTKVEARLTDNTLLIEWAGASPEGRQTLVTWQLAFAATSTGLALKIAQVEVNGKPQVVPEEAALINPVNELIKEVAIGRRDKGLFVGPMGRLRLTEGRISPQGIVVSGRV